MNDITQTTLRLPTQMHIALKVKAATERRQMQTIIIDALAKALREDTKDCTQEVAA